MLKLLKYEFRKAKTSMLVLLGILCGLDVYFLASLFLEQEVHFILAATLLALAAYGGFIFALVRGITSYSAELKDRSAYLIFMTPNSGLKIMASKYLYTLINALLIVGVGTALAVMDVSMIFTKEKMWAQAIEFVRRLLSANGVEVVQIALVVLFYAVFLLLSMLSICANAYFATTLSHTLFRDKKWRGIVSLLIFAVIYWGISYLNGLLPNPVDELINATERAMIIGEGIEVTGDLIAVSGVSINVPADLIPWLLPYMGVSLVTVLLSMFTCGWMLDKKVSL